jgi:poly-beta-hydroxybutyrate-responsive repressor
MCCGGRQHSMERFLNVCLLVLLYDEPGYGYGLMDKLSSFGYDADEMNIGSLYRVLRNMEKSGLIRSSWEHSDSGPKRRVYEITEAGRLDLKQWVGILEHRKNMIDRLLNAYKEKEELHEISEG